MLLWFYTSVCLWCSDKYLAYAHCKTEIQPFVLLWPLHKQSETHKFASKGLS